MAIFRDEEELNQVMMLLWERIKADPEMTAQLINSGLSVQFKYSSPEGIFTLDCTSKQSCTTTVGSTNTKPIIEMAMKADLAHEFWMGRVNIPMALLTGKIISKGPTPKALVLLPIIKPAFKYYPEVLKGLGREDLLSK